MDFSELTNSPTLDITGEISLNIDSCGVVFKRDIIMKSGDELHQRMPLSFADFLKLTTHVREIKEWAQKAQNDIPSLNLAEALNRLRSNIHQRVPYS